ncbi:LysR family transcriptional regulator [Bacillus safensis]|uniref:LysR family transcriptional regulator n=1 Tax=Bacillus safensis TaxID=561879 RepID=UPI000B4538B1|nr:LysR family transcriptional regulator [Bacillus safensis]MCY7493679.1 LysR family transcriptional regulator [Bacillus safensis]MED4993122.1 LysR family transcriptional regulator [Bacillus safensis]UDB46013.1 LysR family transcriptional regulator [Bacillus safensis]
MDIKQLRYFSAIAEEGQITRAAKRLHMAQPPLSQQLKSLEQELEVCLVERNGKELELTQGGKVLYEKAKNILNLMDELVTEIKEVDEGLKGVLSIGAIKTGFSYLSGRLKEFRQRYPKITYRLREGDTFTLAQSLIKREIELAIVRYPLEMNGFSSLSLPEDEFVLITPQGWSDKKTIKVNELAGIPLMLLHRTNWVGLYEVVIEEFNRHGVNPEIICECGDAAMLLSLVRSGVGATLLPKSTLDVFPMNGLETISLEDGTIKSQSAIIWLKERYISKSAVQFIETFKQ